MAPGFFMDASHHVRLTLQRHKASATRQVYVMDKFFEPVEKTKQSPIEIVFKVILNSE